MSSLIFDEGASLKPAKTPRHDGLTTARKAVLGSALPTPATGAVEGAPLAATSAGNTGLFGPPPLRATVARSCGSTKP